LAHNFGSRYSRKSIKDSKDADFGPSFQKKLEPKNVLLDWRTGLGKWGPKNAKTPTLVISSQRTSNSKQKNYFFDLNQKTCWIRRGF